MATCAPSSPRPGCASSATVRRNSPPSWRGRSRSSRLSSRRPTSRRSRRFHMDEAIDLATRLRAIAAAQGKEPFDLLLTSARVIDVATLELRAADVGIVGAMIASVHPPGRFASARETHELAGRVVAPGFIDAHVHFESSHMLPHHYASVVVPQGTTTIF